MNPRKRSIALRGLLVLALLLGGSWYAFFTTRSVLRVETGSERAPLQGVKPATQSSAKVVSDERLRLRASIKDIEENRLKIRAKQSEWSDLKLLSLEMDRLRLEGGHPELEKEMSKNLRDRIKQIRSIGQ